jgi:hypothetical protein
VEVNFSVEVNLHTYRILKQKPFKNSMLELKNEFVQVVLAHIPCTEAETIQKQYVRNLKMNLCKLRFH